MTAALATTSAVYEDRLALGDDVRAAMRGDVRAFERLVDATKRMVTSIALAVVRNVATSEDVAQDVFVSAWCGLPSLRSAASFLPWLREMTRHRAYATLRGSRRHEKRVAALAVTAANATADSALVHALDAEEERALAEAMNALPEESREVLALYYREGSSTAQVAALLELSEEAVRKRLERARATLRRDVLARFEEGMRRTSPGAAFTAAAIALLTTGAPVTASAATSAALALSKGAMSAVLGSLVSVGAAVGGSVLGIHMRFRTHLRTAIDDEERRGLLRVRMRAMVITVGYALLMSLYAFLVKHYVFVFGSPRIAWVALSVLVVAFVAAARRVLRHELNNVLARRRERERLEHPERARRQARREWWRNVGGYVVTTLIMAWLAMHIYLGR